MSEYVQQTVQLTIEPHRCSAPLIYMNLYFISSSLRFLFLRFSSHHIALFTCDVSLRVEDNVKCSPNNDLILFNSCSMITDTAEVLLLLPESEDGENDTELLI